MDYRIIKHGYMWKKFKCSICECEFETAKIYPVRCPECDNAGALELEIQNYKKEDIEPKTKNNELCNDNIIRCKDCRFIIERADGTYGCYRNWLQSCKPHDFCSNAQLSDKEF